MVRTALELPEQVDLVHFISREAHDLRSPFNQVVGFTKIVLNGLDGPLTDVLGKADPRNIALETEDDPPDLAGLSFVESVQRKNRHHEIRLVQGTDPQRLLAALVGRCRVLRFEVKRPTLHEVFLTAVGDESGGEAPTTQAGGQR